MLQSAKTYKIKILEKTKSNINKKIQDHNKVHLLIHDLSFCQFSLFFILSCLMCLFLIQFHGS